MARPLKDKVSGPRGTAVGFRLPQALRDQLDAARRDVEGGGERSLSDEIVRRLRESFDTEKPIKERFGNDFNYALFRVLALGLMQIEAATGQSWHKERFTFDLAKELIDTVLEYKMPAGRATAPKGMVIPEGLNKNYARALGKITAMTTLAGLEVLLKRGDSESSAALAVGQRVAGGHRNFQAMPAANAMLLAAMTPRLMKMLDEHVAANPGGVIDKFLHQPTRKRSKP
ncbi:MAG TPA: hypothetical protein VMU87_16275 [Stellaceae bacterium]|nr:hypothetical protein [Stellaceae bacterium]